MMNPQFLHGIDSSPRYPSPSEMLMASELAAAAAAGLGELIVRVESPAVAESVAAY